MLRLLQQVPHDHDSHPAPQSLEWSIASLLVIPLIAYLIAAARQAHTRRRWSAWRTLSFATGISVLAVAMSPVLSGLAHQQLQNHMVQHLLIGMFAPLALVLGAPVTLCLRTVPTEAGRRVASMLRRRPVHLFSHPIAALILNVGGMYVLYVTPLFSAAISRPWLHALISLHFLLAGYLFTWAIAGPDPAPRRPGIRTRVAILLISMAAHATLGKLMYAHSWPRGTHFSEDEVQEAAMLMYYGGDLAELLLAIALFATWYQSRRRARQRARQRTAPVVYPSTWPYG